MKVLSDTNNWQSKTKIVANKLVVQQALLLNQSNGEQLKESNLCLIQVPADELPLYYQMLIGDLTANKITPISLSDVSVNSDSEYQSINSLYGASKYVIWDVDNCYLPTFASKDKIVIAVSKNDIEENVDCIYVRKPRTFNVQSEELSEEVDSFWSTLRDKVKKEFIGTDVISVESLMEKGEYQLAVIKATMKLEATLRAKYKSPKDRPNYTMYELFQKSLGKKFSDFRRMTQFITYIRNNAVHLDYHPTKDEAMEVMNAIYSINGYIEKTKNTH